jgi:hypothetical protein
VTVRPSAAAGLGRIEEALQLVVERGRDLARTARGRARSAPGTTIGGPTIRWTFRG